MKKIFSLIILTIICAVITAGCSSSFDGMANNSSTSNMMVAESAASYAAQDSADIDRARRERLDFEFDGVYDTIYYELAGDIDFALTSAPAGTSNLPIDRKIIRDANITMEVVDVEWSYNNILTRLAGFGGYEAQRNMHSNTRIYNDRRAVSDPVVSATLKIPAGNLDAFLLGLRDEGEIIISNITSADITEQYFDAQIKLTTLEKTLENYYRFLEEARDIDEQLRITRFINDTTREIEQLKGSLRRWDSLVDYSTVYLHLYRPYEAPIPEPEPREINWNSLSLEDMGWYISSGFLGVVNVIFSMFQWAVIAIATASPIIIPAAILLVFAIRRYKKKKKQYAQYKSGNIIAENNEDNKNEE